MKNVKNILFIHHLSLLWVVLFMCQAATLWAACSGQLSSPIVSAKASDQQIMLTWTAVPDADSYLVTISEGNSYTSPCGGTVVGYVTSTGTNYSCIITSLTNDQIYTTRVIAQSAVICESDPQDTSATPTGSECYHRIIALPQPVANGSVSVSALP